MSSRGAKKTKKRSKKVTPKAAIVRQEHAGLAPMLTGDGIVIGVDGSLSVQPSLLTPPAKAFAADGATVIVREPYGCLDMYFAASGTVFDKPHQVVRVRFPTEQFVRQLHNDREFIDQLRANFAQVDFDLIWSPTPKGLDEVPGSMVANLEGTLNYMAYSGASAQVDVHRLPTDSARRIENNQQLGLTGQIRIQVPTVVLLKLLLEIFDKIGKVE